MLRRRSATANVGPVRNWLGSGDNSQTDIVFIKLRDLKVKVTICASEQSVKKTICETDTQ